MTRTDGIYGGRFSGAGFKGCCMALIDPSAGYATRLYPLTKNFPKPLLKIKDKAILDWLIDDMLVIAGDNVLDFSLVRFIEYARAKGTSCIMRFFEPSEQRLRKCGVVEVSSEDLVLGMEEKPSEPRSHWCCPPFYYYTRKDASLISAGITAGCGTDAPGSYIVWISTQTPVHAMEMPGHRYDIGNLESYHTVCEQYDGIQPTATK